MNKRQKILLVFVFLAAVIVKIGARSTQETKPVINPDQKIFLQASWISACPMIGTYTDTDLYERYVYDSDFVQIERIDYQDFTDLLVISTAEGKIVASARSLPAAHATPYLPETIIVNDRAKFEEIGRQLEETLSELSKHRVC